MRILLAWLSLPVLASCIASNPPADAVRWFDPRPAPAPALPARELPLPRVAVVAGPGIRQEFVLRTAPRELAIDELHRWNAPPEQLVAQALEQALGRAVAGAGAVAVTVVRFELELTAGARAVVELAALLPAGPVHIVGDAPAADRSPAALAEAMAQALGSAVLQLRAALAGG
jgi:uncharacterized lipoprotein YmbA